MLYTLCERPDVMSLFRYWFMCPHILQDRALYRREIVELVIIYMASCGLVVVGYRRLGVRC